MKRRRFLPALIAVIVVVAVVLGLIWLRSYRPAAQITPSPTSSASASASVGPSTSGGASGGGASVQPPAPTAGEWSSAAYSRSFTGTVPPLPTLVALRTGAHPEGGYDRIAFDFRQAAAPGYTVKYVSQATKDASGQPVTVVGAAILQIVFTPAAAHDDAGQTTLPSPPTSLVRTGYAGLQSYILTGDFEGTLSFALGQAANTGFTVEQIHQPNGLWTVYVDVPRP